MKGSLDSNMQFELDATRTVVSRIEKVLLNAPFMYIGKQNWFFVTFDALATQIQTCIPFFSKDQN